MLDEQAALLQNVVGAIDLEAARQHVVPQGGALGGGEGHGGQMPGLHLVDDLGGGQDVLLPVAALPGDAQDDGHPQVDARLHQTLTGLEHLLGADPLVDELQHRVAAALHPQIGPGQTGIVEGLQLLRRFGQGAAGPGIQGDLLQGGEGVIQLAEDAQQVLRLDDDGVAVHQEHPLQTGAVIGPGHVDVL